MSLLLHPQDFVVRVHADADFVRDRNDRKSTTGLLTTLGGAPINWMAKKQDIVSASTTYAEYVALIAAVDEVRYIVRVFEGLEFPIEKPILYCDNTAAIALANSQSDKPRSIDIKYHYVRDAVTDQEAQRLRIESRNNLADVFTKSLPIALF